ncbi:hypothetical protein FRB96_002645 [Tulasnella sp. 330]|nr:hypothetical protein FRB96_002645 [Tulasnella sp. 330]KAG8882874.1 hypothetical protein FRB97_007593 [Tulasnella sp. 331]
MATVPRKKSVGANAGPPLIDIPQGIPQGNNQLLNKAASSSTSLYQQCSQLRAKLLRIYGFAPFLALAAPLPTQSNRQSHSTDPVRQLWDCFALGTPLCFLYNLMPGKSPLNVNTDPEDFDPDNMKERKHATAKFIIAITAMKNDGDWGSADVFTISELHSETRDTNGFVKASLILSTLFLVVNTITKLVELLPQDLFKPEEAPPSPPSLPSSAQHATGIDSSDTSASCSTDKARKDVIRELIETERKFVGDLEIMREYATALGASGVMDQDTIHLLFPGLNQLLDFQRQFLITLEGIYEQPWHNQHWGAAFAAKEDEFAVYEPYCANYTNASELLLIEEQNLMALSDMINPRSELPAFLIKPVQRVCKYPLLLQSMVKFAGPDYPLKDELIEGWNVTKRVTDRVNEAQRREENRQTVKALESRVEDWKGHHIPHFGDLLLDEIFFVTKSDVDREYHVFLFEKIILCCKEVPSAGAATPGDKRKSGKSNSMLKKSLDKATPTASGAAGKKRMTPLVLKGRIFLNNVTSAMPSRKDGHALQLWWRGDDDVEYFTLRCRTEEQLKQWESTVNRLILHRDGASTQRAERPPLNGGFSHPPPSASAGQASYTSRARYPSQSSSTTMHSGYGGEFPVTPATPGFNGMHPNGLANGTGSGLRDRKDSSADEDYFGDDRGYDSPYGSVPSGRSTPSGAPLRKPHASLPPPQKPGRGPLIRGMSTASESAVPLPHVPSGRAPMPPHVRSQFSSSRLRDTFEEQSGQRGQMSNLQLQQQQQHSRMRSTSTPTQYTPGTEGLPPLPSIPTKDNASWTSSVSTAVSSAHGDKRGSGSSQSTNESSDFSQTTSPVTPYGSNDSSLASATRPDYNSPVRVKVHFGQDLFMIVVQRSIDYHDLMDRVGKKIRLCGARNDNAAFRVRYKDEDGDMISLASNDDLQIALAEREVALYVV